MGFNPVQKMCKDQASTLALSVSNFHIPAFASQIEADKPRCEKWILRKARYKDLSHDSSSGR